MTGMATLGMVTGALGGGVLFVNWFILPFYVSDALNVNAKTLGFLLMLMPTLRTRPSPQ